MNNFKKQFTQEYPREAQSDLYYITNTNYINWLETHLGIANEKIRQYEDFILDLSEKIKELQKISQQ